MIYIIVLFLLLCLSLRYDINGKTKYRDECYLIMLVVFILIAGLRWRLMVDTPNYIYKFYHWTPTLDKFSFADYPIGKDPLYVLLNSIVKTLGGRFYVVQLIEASFVNILVFNYIKRYSKYLFTCLFFYAITNYMGLCMETMRASFSIVICLYANDYILNKKWVKGYLLFILALMFHAQTILMFVLPLFFSLRLNKIGVICLIGAFVIGLLLHTILEDYVSLLEMGDAIDNKVSDYAESENFGGVRGGIGFLIAFKLPSLIYPLISLIFLKKWMPNSKLLKLEPFVMLGVAFAIVRLNFEIAYRYANYFGVINVIFYSEFFIKIIHRAKKVDLRVACLRAIIYFFPFFFLVGLAKYVRLPTFYPYSSVIERKIDRNRESRYMKGDKFTPPANVNEY